MEEVLGLVGVSLGATLGFNLVRTAARGGRSVLREVLKVGIGAWESTQATVSAAREEARAERERTASAPRRRREPRKIAISPE